jgi:phage terminase Nu1 subunit (DNA packaging protein)
MEKTSPPEGLPPEFSLGQLRWMLNLTNSRVQQLEQSGVIVRTRPGYYRADSIRNYIAFLRRSQDGAPRDWQSARVELARERATLLRLERRQREGELLEKADVTNLNVGIMRTVRDRLLATPPAVAVRLIELRRPQEAEAIVREGIVAALSELSGLAAVADGSPRRRNGHREADRGA